MVIQSCCVLSYELHLRDLVGSIFSRHLFGLMFVVRLSMDAVQNVMRICIRVPPRPTPIERQAIQTLSGGGLPGGMVISR